MLKTAILILLIYVSSVLGQTVLNDSDKQEPKAALFDEFGEIGQEEIKSRTLKLREKLQETNSKHTGLEAYIYLYANKNKIKQFAETKKIIINALYDNCRDCYGYGGGRIIYLDAGKIEKQKIQFWLVPPGAEPPTP